MKIITCFGDWTRSGTFFIIVLASPIITRSLEDNSVSRTDNFINVFKSVTSTRLFSYSCISYYFWTMPVGFSFIFNLTYRLKPQVSGIKIVTVYRRSIFQVEWLITTLIVIRNLSVSVPFLFHFHSVSFLYPFRSHSHTHSVSILHPFANGFFWSAL